MANFVQYLTLRDYLPVIQNGQLNDQVLDLLEDGGEHERTFCESWAIGKVRGKLKHRFNLQYEITPTLPYDPTKKYYFNSRVIIDYPEWESKKYVTNDCVIYDGKGWVCLIDNENESFDESKWTCIGNQYELYYIAPPCPMFSIAIGEYVDTEAIGIYNSGDKVFYKNHIFTCLQPTSQLSQAEIIQYQTYNDLPKRNSYPTIGSTNGAWFDEGEKVFVGEHPYKPIDPADENPEIWTKGDNRDPVLVLAIVDLTIWRLHSRISPRNIPELRVQNMEMVFDWMNGLNKGSENSDMIPLQPTQGEDLRWGSDTKKSNGY